MDVLTGTTSGLLACQSSSRDPDPQLFSLKSRWRYLGNKCCRLRQSWICPVHPRSQTTTGGQWSCFHRHQTKELACKWRNDLKHRVSVGLRSRMRELAYPFIYFQRSREKRRAEGQGGEVNAAEACSPNGWVVTDSQRRLCSLSRWVVADDHRSELQGSWVLFQEQQKQSRDTRKQQSFLTACILNELLLCFLVKPPSTIYATFSHRHFSD